MFNLLVFSTGKGVDSVTAMAFWGLIFRIFLTIDGIFRIVFAFGSV